ncbi:MAG: DegQ family serine endoprotease [Hyphomicrobiales bacterium]|nr:DegQ family serine endoprotease [Hyphomicrobiales bacterium]
MRLSFLRAAAVVGAALFVGNASAQALLSPERVAPQSRAQTMLSFAPVVKRAQPSVVNVYASRKETVVNNPLFDDPIFRHFFGDRAPGAPGGQTAQSLGSGVIVDPAGLIITNYHVIDGMTDVKVALSDKREYEASILVRDQRTDLAVLKLKGATGLPAMELGDSDALEVGDLVLAIGNPFGVGQTVTQGIVSALARTQAGISDYGFFIQTDAAINPGNSGGALVDMNARLVGVNSAIYSKSGGSVGIGFAIPVNMVKTVIAAAKGGVGQVRRPWLGATLQTVSKEIADSIGLDRPSGALVADVIEAGPAAAGGVKRGDVIVAVDGQPVDDPEGFGYRFGTHAIGGQAQVAVLRGGKKIILPVALSAAPETPPRDPVTIHNQSPLAGGTFVNLSPATMEAYSVEGASSGVVVAEVEANSNAAAINLQRGDVLVAVNDARIARTSDIERAAAGRHYYWKITITRGGQTLTTVIGG